MENERGLPGLAWKTSPAHELFQIAGARRQRYFSNWIDSAKTEETRAKRIRRHLNAMLKSMKYSEMIRAMKADKDKF